MKFLIALSVLASSAVFANDFEMPRTIKCYEPAQQGGMAEVAYVLKEHGDSIRAVHPFKQDLELDEEGCLAAPEIEEDPEEDEGDEESFGATLKLCPGMGQQVNHKVPVEATYGSTTSDIYCDRTILPWFLAGEQM